MVDAEQEFELAQQTRYGRLRRNVMLAASLVAIAPLLVTTLLSAFQYEKVYRAEAVGPLARHTMNARQTIESFLEERTAALRFVISNESLDQLARGERLPEVFRNLGAAFGGFVDLGLIDDEGAQLSYVGPYDLLGRDYRDQDWFLEVRLRGTYVSDVFLGYRRFPHFVIAVRHDDPGGRWHVLRATIDSEELNRRIRGVFRDPASDAFLVNGEGLLQTPSRLYGDVLQPCPLPLPSLAREAEVAEIAGADGRPLLVGHSYIEGSPFLFLLVNDPRDMMAAWQSTRRDLIGFAAVSVVLILAVIWFSATHMVRRIREADRKRAAVLHKAEYTQRMATLGRLAAGVAHEINNPLAIIGEKSGLIEDLVSAGGDAPHRERILQLVHSIAGSVDRAGRITHRLLGFARHIEVERERLSLRDLIGEVLGFLEKEAEHRNVTMSVEAAEDLPLIESDRGQLQQVFLNILNNALAAVPESEGRVDIALRRAGPDRVAVEIADNGSGIERENLGHIFEPFFTTKKGYGTGLGLSITYGIVKKLGGDVSVASEPGRWTRFVVELPLEPPSR